jgi:hypothetical protein|nr:MAG TPA: hypothetical protein [Caudoviricetes sp.]
MRFKDVVKVVKVETKEYGRGRNKGEFQSVTCEGTFWSGKATIFPEEDSQYMEKGDYEFEFYLRVSESDGKYYINPVIIPESVKEK